MNFKGSEKAATTTGVCKSSAIDDLKVALKLSASSVASFEGLPPASLLSCSLKTCSQSASAYANRTF